jgi:hypothetical protein
MFLVYKKLNVRVSKFFKVTLPKTTDEESNFETITTNIIDDQIVYQLHDTIDIITFCKKANLNVYNRFQNTQDYILKEHLKVNIIPKHVVYAYKGHDFNVYLADEFIFIAYSKNDKKSDRSWTWYIVIYDTKRNILTRHSDTFYKSYGGIYGFYYLRKCRKVILPVGNPTFSDEVFHNSHDKRRGFNLRGFYVVYLTESIDNRYSYGFIYITSHAEKYVKTKYADKHSMIVDTIIDYTIDVNSGIMYIIYKIKRRSDYDYKTSIIVLEYNLCGKNITEIFEVDFNRFKIFGIEFPIPIIEDASVSNNMLLYLSNKRLRDRGMPKYLPMHIFSEFYDFMSNKLFHAEMIFSSHSKPLVRDRHFNRMDSVLAKIESLKVAAHIPLQEDVITMRSGHNDKLLAMLLMNDLAIVKAER